MVLKDCSMKELCREVTCLRRMPTIKEAETSVCEGLFHGGTVQGSDLPEKDALCEGSMNIPGGLS